MVFTIIFLQMSGRRGRGVFPKASENSRCKQAQAPHYENQDQGKSKARKPGKSRR